MRGTIIFALWLIGVFGPIITSAVMAIKGVEGWGWFLFVGVLLASGFSYNENDKNKKEG